MIDIERFRTGDEAYFREVFREFGPLVLDVARSFGTSVDHVEDLFQETWQRIYDRRATFEGRGSFRAWVHRVATNVCISEYRARRAHDRRAEAIPVDGVAAPSQWDGGDPIEDLEARRLRADVHGALGHLSARELEAVTLRILEGRSPDEAAAIMRVRKATVRSLMRHAMSRLRGVLQEEGT